MRIDNIYIDRRSSVPNVKIERFWKLPLVLIAKVLIIDLLNALVKKKISKNDTFFTSK